MAVFSTLRRGRPAWVLLWNLLTVRTFEAGLQDRWLNLVRRDTCFEIVVLVVYLGASIYDYFEEAGKCEYPHSVWAKVVLVAAIFIGLVHVAILHCMLSTCRAVVVLIDNFANSMVTSSDLSKAMRDWKLIQAILRKYTANVEWTFIIEIGGALALLPAFTVDMITENSSPWRQASLALPAVTIAAGTLHLCLVAASITGKCNRVPALVNALSFGPGTETFQHRIVEYIIHSDVGFSVANTKLSLEMVLKSSYTICVIVFGAWSTLFMQRGSQE